MSPGVEDEWCFKYVGSGEYQIMNRWQNVAIDVANFGTSPGSNLQGWAAHGGPNQMFTVEIGPAGPYPTPPPQPPNPLEDWAGPYGTPIIGVALANLPNGNILMWSAYAKDNFGYDSGKTWTAIYDHDEGSISELLVDTTNHDVSTWFCLLFF